MLTKPVLTIRCDYPGGNVKVNQIKPGLVELESDLRDTPTDWFYWNFEVKTDAPGIVKFVFPPKRLMISAQGPCVSTDNGLTWHWLGRDKTVFFDTDLQEDCDSFYWEFKQAGETVRFAQGFPYQLADFENFVQKTGAREDLELTSYATTGKGKVSPMLIIANAPGKQNVLLTARHHCCEATANYVWEGFVEEALSDSVFGIAFRKKYNLYAIPFVDLDGVEAGDQGKNRAPYDHNRDYGVEKHQYSEIEAIEKLHRDLKFAIALDFHDPAVRTDAHENFYFAGFRSPKNKVNTAELIHWVMEESPEECGPTLQLGFDQPLGLPEGMGYPFSYYFESHPDVIYGTTLENPYATIDSRYSIESAREYGRGVLRAMMRFEFTTNAEPHTGHQKFVEFCNSFCGSSEDIIQKAAAVLKQSDFPELYRAEANLRLAGEYARMQKKDLAKVCNEAVLASTEATMKQKRTAEAQLKQL